jgi:hypothetical protein
MREPSLCPEVILTIPSKILYLWYWINVRSVTFTALLFPTSSLLALLYSRCWLIFDTLIFSEWGYGNLVHSKHYKLFINILCYVSLMCSATEFKVVTVYWWKWKLFTNINTLIQFILQIPVCVMQRYIIICSVTVYSIHNKFVHMVKNFNFCNCPTGFRNLPTNHKDFMFMEINFQTWYKVGRQNQCYDWLEERSWRMTSSSLMSNNWVLL